MKAKLILSILSFIFLISCSNDDSHTKEILNLRDEKEIFSEIFFGNNTKNEIPQIKNGIVKLKSSLSHEQLKEVRKMENLIMKNMYKLDPTFFSNFNNAITSGDHLRIEEEIEKSSDLLEKAILRIPELSNEFLQAKELVYNLNPLCI
uniref:hypothetical protein n=1 Tax=Ornithobacterium rhinotracheale TaxID=28251 RepID=UPI0039A4F54C